MADSIKIKRALISVFDKTGVLELANILTNSGVEILSTGGTAKLLAENNINVTKVSDVTGFPEILGGRVKTLHPYIHGGILAKRNKSDQMEELYSHAPHPPHSCRVARVERACEKDSEPPFLLRSMHWAHDRLLSWVSLNPPSNGRF